MKYTVDAKQYTSGRMTIMGIAAILITWFHSTVQTVPYSIWWQAKMIGDIGVDMFLFVSGMGLYFAVHKYSAYANYLAARFRKVLIPYLCAGILWGYYRHTVWGVGIREILKNITLVDFWLEGNLSSWYIAAILGLYLITPPFVKIWKRHSWVVKAAFVGVIAAAMAVQWIPRWKHLEIVLFRIPVYLTGLWFGRAAYEERRVQIPIINMILLLASGAVVVMSCFDYLPFVLPLGYKYLGYLPWVVGLSFLISKCSRNWLTDYFGKRSLEMYLVFEKVLEVLSDNPRMEIFVGSTALVFNGIVLAVTLVCVELLRLICILPQRFLICRKGIDNLRKQ